MKPAQFIASILFVSPAFAQQFGTFESLPGDTQVRASAGDQSAPFVAPGNGMSLVVWEDGQSSLVDTVFGGGAFGTGGLPNHDIHGMLVDADGVPLLDAPIAIAVETFDQVRPRAAWNGSEFLVVFETTRPTTTFHSKAIEAVRVAANGDVIDTTPILIFDTPGADECCPVVASTGGDWLVAWQGRHPGNQMPIVEGRMMLSSGTLMPRTMLVGAAAGFATDLALAATSGRYCLVFDISFGSGMRARLFDGSGSSTTPVLILEQSTGKRPAVAAGPSGFLAAWTFGSTGLEATTIDLAGALGTPGGVTLSPPQTSAIFNLSAGWDGNKYTLAYTRSSEVWAVQADAAGGPLGGPMMIDSSPRTAVDIAVGGLNGKALITWTDTRITPNSFGGGQQDVLGMTLDGSGTPSTPGPLSVSPPTQFGARIAGDPQSGLLVVYNSWSAGRTRIMAQAVDAAGQPISPAPFVVAEAPDRILYCPDVAWNGFEFFVVWHRLRSPFSTGTPPPSRRVEGCC